MDITFCELRNKDVVNVCDGKKLGRLIDISMSTNGQVLGLVLPGDKSVFKTVVNAQSVFVPWRCICKIGDDAILVNLQSHGFLS